MYIYHDKFIHGALMRNADAK